MFQYSLFHIIDKGAVAIGGNNKTVVSLCTDIVFAEAVVQSLFFAQQVDVAIDAQRREDNHVAILGRYKIGALDGFQESRTARHLKIGRAGHLHRPEVDGIGYTLHKENPLVVPSHRCRRLVQQTGMRSKTGFPDHSALLVKEIEHSPIVHESHQVAHTLTLSEISLCLALHARTIVVIQSHLAGYPGMMTGICEHLLDISGERRSLPGIIGADKLPVGILDKADAFLGIIEPYVATITHHARITAHVIIAPRIIFEICQPEIVASQIR